MTKVLSVVVFCALLGFGVVQTVRYQKLKALDEQMKASVDDGSTPLPRVVGVSSNAKPACTFDEPCTFDSTSGRVVQSSWTKISEITRKNCSDDLYGPVKQPIGSYDGRVIIDTDTDCVKKTRP